MFVYVFFKFLNTLLRVLACLLRKLAWLNLIEYLTTQECSLISDQWITNLYLIDQWWNELGHWFCQRLFIHLIEFDQVNHFKEYLSDDLKVNVRLFLFTRLHDLDVFLRIKHFLSQEHLILLFLDARNDVKLKIHFKEDVQFCELLIVVPFKVI